MSTLEEQLIEHVRGIERVCGDAATRDPAIADALHGHLNRALDSLDEIQDILSEVKEDAAGDVGEEPPPAQG